MRFSGYAYILVITLIMLANICEAATLSQIQKGTTILNAGSGSTTQSITSVDLSTSFLVFSLHVASNRPGGFQIGGYLSSDDEITFHRYDVSGTPEVTINWQVFEFSSGVAVQRGTVTNLVASGSNVTLSPTIDTSESFAIMNMRKDGGQYGSDDGITANITSSSNLYIDRESGGANPQNVHWQVVEWSGASVEKIVTTMSSGSDSTSYTLSSTVDMDKTMVLGNHRVSGNVDVSDLPATELYDENTVLFTRTTTTANMYFVIYVVEFSDNTDVIHGAFRMLLSEKSVTTDICTVDESMSGIILPSNMGRAGGNCQSTDDHVGSSWATVQFTDDNTLLADRASTGYAMRLPFQVLEFTASTPSGCTPPEPGASTPRTAPGGNGLCLMTLPIELLDFEVEAIDGLFVKLGWATASELNNEVFDIERSPNLVDFESVAQVAGSGTTFETRYYHHTDLLPGPGSYYYRLKQTDTDGTYSYGPILSVLAGQNDLFSVYPNPSEQYIKVGFAENSNGDRVVIANAVGQIVMDITIKDHSRNVLEFSLEKGVYYISAYRGMQSLGTSMAIIQ